MHGESITFFFNHDIYVRRKEIMIGVSHHIPELKDMELRSFSEVISRYFKHASNIRSIWEKWNGLARQTLSWERVQGQCNRRVSPVVQSFKDQ